MLSIIIPTLNEQNFLPFLLKSIKDSLATRPGLVEVIVADAGSEDKTKEIAKKYNCKIVNGGLPAVGRNKGAKKAKGDLLLFLDADVILPKDFFKRALEEFKKKNLDVAAFRLEPQSKRKIHKIIYEIFYNWVILVSEKYLAHGAQAILVKKDIYEIVGGFDEEIKFAEDQSFIRKAKKFGNFGILRSVKVLSSIRRFEKEGWIPLYLKYVLAEIYMILFGDIKKNIFKYEFGHFEKRK